MVVSYLETLNLVLGLYHLSDAKSWHVKFNQNMDYYSYSFVRKWTCVFLNLSSTLILKLSPVVNAVILVNQTKEIWKDFTRFAIISKPNIQITPNKNPVEAKYIAYHIIVNFYKTDIQISQKKCSFNDALLLTHAVYTVCVLELLNKRCSEFMKLLIISTLVIHQLKLKQKFYFLFYTILFITCSTQ